MTFNEGVRIDSNRVRTSRGRRGAAVGGGIGGIGLLVVIILSQLTGTDLTPLIQGGGSVPEEVGQDLSNCQTGADANEQVECRVIAALESLDVFWYDTLPAEGYDFVQPGAVLFQDAVQTEGCGPASSAVGPFYCPPDQTIYLDTAFYAELTNRFGSSGGPLAEMYVVAHEYGHHVSNLTGAMAGADRSGTGPDSDSVRIELQADCYAGMWAGAAATTVDPETGQTFLQPLTKEQVADALSAAAAVGDDRIQEQATGTVNPEAWTHGSAEQRMNWFTIGYEHGSLAACDAMSAATL